MQICDAQIDWTNGRQLSSIYFDDEEEGRVDIISFTYDDNGIRVSKSYEGTTTYYTSVDGKITSQYEIDPLGFHENEMIYLYNSFDEVIGVRLNDSNFYFIKNALNDVIGYTNADHSYIRIYDFSAWGNLVNFNDFAANSRVHLYDGVRYLNDKNPFGYRSYYRDWETRFFYLRSRYYDPEMQRFINADNPTISRLCKNIYNGANLFTYCFNDPVNNTDSTGAFPWSVVAKMLLGALSQYGGDIINNIIDGKTGINIFKPYSSIGIYIGAATSALVGGNKFLNSLGRAAINTAADYIEKRIAGQKQSIKTVLYNLIKNLIVDYICSFISKVAVNKIQSLSPKNYSSFAKSCYLKNKNLTPEQIKKQMQTIIRANIFAANVFDFLASSVANAI